MASSLLVQRLSLLLVASTLLCSVGCASTPILNKFLLLDTDDAAEAKPLDPNTPHVTVMLVPAKGKMRRARIPFRDGMVVSDVVGQTKAMKRFKRENIEILRKTPRDIRPLRMHVKCDRKKQGISGGSDYALHPGDIIQVMEDKSGAVDDWLGNALGPIGAKAVQSSMPSL